ncbi:hypothetical protein PROFUN_03823 [Planoprotostelium fungivorum]|uniref:Transmembrane protein n=1 Tax=Planoprotostelium fungivorum TaxID=1890364 RepID=A0A2P6NI79_9EUKA|nr:hypothetical protein PROFUN_03823 [Planoprotostelium fungivorum]
MAAEIFRECNRGQALEAESYSKKNHHILEHFVKNNRRLIVMSADARVGSVGWGIIAVIILLGVSLLLFCLSFRFSNARIAFCCFLIMVVTNLLFFLGLVYAPKGDYSGYEHDQEYDYSVVGRGVVAALLGCCCCCGVLCFAHFIGQPPADFEVT